LLLCRRVPRDRFADASSPAQYTMKFCNCVIK
jgi:hypothetical protein